MILRQQILGTAFVWRESRLGSVNRCWAHRTGPASRKKDLLEWFEIDSPHVPESIAGIH